MDLDNCIKERRSCRDYKDEKVPLEVIGELIQSASYAPSAGNIQNWKFIIVTDKSKREALADLCLRQVWMKQAPLHIVVCNERKRITGLYQNKGDLYSMQNCAVAIQNLMLKAQDLGLGTCWVGAFNEKSIQNLLNIPEDVIPEAIITIGYPIKYEEEIERIPLDKIVFFDTYGNKKIERSIFPLAKQVEKLEIVEEKTNNFFKNILNKIKKK